MKTQTLSDMLEDWKWRVSWLVGGWEWSRTRRFALMPISDTCGAKMKVEEDFASVTIFNRTIPGDVDIRHFSVVDCGGSCRTADGTYKIDLSDFCISDFCRDIEKYIRFFVPSAGAPYRSNETP